MTGIARRVLDYDVPALVADDHRGCAILIALRSEVIARMVDGRFPGATPKDGVYLRVIFVERDRISHGSAVSVLFVSIQEPARERSTGAEAGAPSSLRKASKRQPSRGDQQDTDPSGRTRPASAWSG